MIVGQYNMEYSGGGVHFGGGHHRRRHHRDCHSDHSDHVGVDKD